VATAQPFRGIPAEAFDFYDGLTADNSKAFWTEHRDTYESCVKAPLESLLAETAAEFGPGRLFRPHRDVRFSHDKSPYKTNQGAVAERHGAVSYVSLSADGLLAGSGWYRLGRAQLDRFRRAVDGRAGAALEDIVADLEARGCVLGGEALKRAPRGYAPDHPRARLLRHKGLYASRSWEPAAWMGTRQALDRVVELWREARPLNRWLADNVGPEPDDT
jgi:uncharacterized protein (TIGR02453 family)